MSELTYTHLEQLGLLTVSGNDAAKFLQGQCTQDVLNLPPGQAVPGAFCTAKGRAVTTVRLIVPVDAPTRIHIVCEASSTEPLLQHLKKYILFFRGTTIENHTEQTVILGIEGENSATKAAELIAETSGFSGTLGKNRELVFLTHEEFQNRPTAFNLSASDNWQKHDIEQSILWLNSEQIEKWIPQNFSLDETGGISFKKGCYTGQEVIARLHYKGQSKKRLFRLKWDNPNTDAINEVYGKSSLAGQVVQQVKLDGQIYALAILNTDKTESLFADENQQLAIELLE